ncbi:MAG: hypothetical protein LBG43_04660 [Treponema sp.]|jgi:hypothetical protein|nr:hypothetical protein [Treponema sp.]
MGKKEVKQWSLEKWLVVGMFGWGLPVVIILSILFWEDLAQSEMIINLTPLGAVVFMVFFGMSAGCLAGYTMYLYTRIVLKLRNKLKRRNSTL